ncbi:MAG TPA: efflux RND transporter periplasmic adaptor subunit [Hyphomicrobiaceae bacterium]|nr:efflux RND transporter periplasmic adaptor subunit [Hyphomicrobiaceae bacterium]
MPRDTPPPSLNLRKLRFGGLLAATVAATIVATGIVSRERSSARLREWTDAQAVPTVAVVAPSARPLSPYLNLPGRLEAYSRAPIYARVSGYLKDWKVDIGARVRAGQLLAEIDAPDLDQQLMQARADLLNAQSSARLSEATLKRRQSLAEARIISQQDLDERIADLASKQAAVKSNQANVERLEALAGYKNVLAPFDGMITARETDLGALINAGSSSAPAMFVVSDTSRLRVYVNVPQSFVPAIRVGSKAMISVPEYADRSFPASIEFSSQAVDGQSGTTRMQLIVGNDDGLLLAGAYANVRIDLSRDLQTLHIPASALLFDQDGLRVATVADGDKVVLKAVKIARDLGREIEIAAGLSKDDKVIISPPDGLVDGTQVRISKSGP